MGNDNQKVFTFDFCSTLQIYIFVESLKNEEDVSGVFGTL